MSAKLPTIIDNRSGNTLLAALARLLEQTHKLDVATGTFELGSLLALEGKWQVPQSIRVIMGDETTQRTKKELLQALQDTSRESIEDAKERDDTLTGLDAVRDAIKKDTLAVRVYAKAKFHPKCYLMDVGESAPVDFALVGSSNFTRSGLTRNLELNLMTADQFHVAHLKEWYEDIWKEAENVKDELLGVIEPHLKDYPPFTVYARSLFEFFAGREKGQDAWEIGESVIYRKLSLYQRHGYHRALQIASEWNGALICDGVGLGKTFIGLMILERCLRDKKRVLLIVPKSVKESVWDANIERLLKPRYRRLLHELLDIRKHTDFGRDGGIAEDDLEYFKNDKQVIIIDEAHHFRNPRSNRGELFMEIARGKEIYFLTATPINNGLDDLYHLINYFAQNRQDYFSRIRINHLRKYFLENEARIEEQKPNMDAAEAVEAEDFLRTDELLKHILIQRSRKYVQDSELETGGTAAFPERQKPRVIEYSLRSVYESIYAELKDAFDKDRPFLTLAIYNTAAYSTSPDAQEVQRQKQVIGLIRTLFLKRLESSFKAFEASAEDLLAKMARFLKTHSPETYDAWTTTNRRWWRILQEHIQARLEREEAEEEDELPGMAPELNPEEFRMQRLLRDVHEDMNILSDFLSKIYRRFYIEEKEGAEEDPKKDDKLQKLLDKLQSDTLLVERKVIIFTEFRDTARYLARRLVAAGLDGVEQVDSGRNVQNRESILRRFSPHYNCLPDSEELAEALGDPIRILISTDVLSEGLNLQDASLLINYDLHWNPVRLMQRIGRIDRRVDSEIERRIRRPSELQGKIYFWNFLPPRELEDLLHLKERLDGKIMRINKTLGIEGALLTPDDPEMSLKEFNRRYEGKESIEELMELEQQRIIRDHPDLWESLGRLPRRLFSGKLAGDGFAPICNKQGEELLAMRPDMRRGVFCCFRMPPVIGPAPTELFEYKPASDDPSAHPPGEVRWYFYDAEVGKVSEGPEAAWLPARCQVDTPRSVKEGPGGATGEARKAIERHIRNTYMRDAQVPANAKPVLLAWMEIG